MLPGNLVAMVPNALIPMVLSILDMVHRAARRGPKMVRGSSIGPGFSLLPLLRIAALLQIALSTI